MNDVELYINRGWRVFPCHTVINGRCSCGKPDCENIGKHPRTANGLKAATCDECQIAKWWPERSLHPSNTAIATGRQSGLVVVDIDPRHGGDKTLAQMEAEYGDLPRDWSVKTGGDGLHIYLVYPNDVGIKSRNGWRQGIDVKADRGYVVTPPSIHASGNNYRWQCQSENYPPPIPPAWLAILSQANSEQRVERTTVSDARSLLLQRAQKYAASIPGAAEGARNQTAFGVAGHIAAFVDDMSGRLGEQDILGVVATWNARCSPPLLASELEICVSSALRNGKPRADKEVRSADEPSERDDDNHVEPAKSGKNQATILVELAEGTELFHDPDGEAFARVPVGDENDLHWQVARVRTRAFKRWLAQRFYRTEGKVPSAQAMQDALGVVEAKAVFDGDRCEVAIRVAERNGRIYYDLCNKRWQVVEIDKSGWRILDISPVMFRRSKAMMALPTPSRAADINQLREFANVTDEDWPLVVAWLVAAMRPTGPFPVLAVHGEHGSGKSGLCRRLRSLVDPNTSPLRGDYREPRDLMICANSGWVVALDNLSNIPAWLSDCFCRLSTGGGFSCRTLYENDEETIFEATRPLILNCIEEVVTRSDLLDRCVLVNLPRIEQDQRVSEKQLDRDFEAARPRILGGLFTAISTALRHEDSIQLRSLPRMADFAIWVTAAEPALGLAPGQFLATYQANREAGNDTAIESSPIGKAVLDFVAEVGAWAGSSTELQHHLEARVDESFRKAKTWPSTPRTLSGVVKRLAPNFREAGLTVEFGRTGRSRTISLGRARRDSTVISVTSVTSPEKQSFRGDDEMTQNQLGDASDLSIVTADYATFPEKNGCGDARDADDAENPIHSYDPQWSEA